MPVDKLSWEFGVIRRVGEMIGFGNMMHLANAAWQEANDAQSPGLAGGAFVVGPCQALTVRCLCRTESGALKSTEGSCDWCCGAGWLTAAVHRVVVKDLP